MASAAGSVVAVNLSKSRAVCKEAEEFASLLKVPFSFLFKRSKTF